MHTRNALLRIFSGLMLFAGLLVYADAQVIVRRVGRVPGPVTMAYQYGRNHLVGASYFDLYDPNNNRHRDYWQIDTSRYDPNFNPFPYSSNVSRFGSLPTNRFTPDRYSVAAPTVNLGSGFLADWIYAARRDTQDASRFNIVQFNPDGTNANPTWATIERPFTNNFSLFFDQVGTFQKRLLGVYNGASDVRELFAIDINGNVAQIASWTSPNIFLDGLVIPNDTRFGSAAGKILVGSTSIGELYLVDNNGNVQQVGSLGIPIRNISLITGTHLYFANWAEAAVDLIIVPELGNYLGDILILSDDYPNQHRMYRLYWDGHTFQKQLVINLAEHGVPYSKGASIVLIPEPSSILLFGSSLAGLLAIRKRCRRHREQT